jgi:hypothetical protein
MLCMITPLRLLSFSNFIKYSVHNLYVKPGSTQPSTWNLGRPTLRVVPSY